MNKLVVDLPVAAKRVGLLKSPQKKVKTERKSVSSAHKLDGLGKLKEHAPRSEHVHLHQDIGHIRKNHLHATLLPQLSKYAHASGIYAGSRWRYRPQTHNECEQVHM